MKAVALVVLAACGREAPAAAPAIAAAPPIRAPIVIRAPLPTAPRSLDGTQPDGALHAGARGHVIADADARRLFDYYLTAEGEEPDATIRARVADRARALGVDPDDALALFDRYVAYRADGAALFRQAPAPADPALALDELRRTHFGGDADAFFTR